MSEENSTVVLSIKGTTLNGPTSKKDKFNDNLLFSCCCALVDFSWVFSTVCNCWSSHWRCDNTCLSEALIQDSLFYNVGVVSNYGIQLSQHPLMTLSEPRQQLNRAVPGLNHLARRPFPRRRPRLPPRHNLRPPRRRLRIPRRTPRRAASAPPPAAVGRAFRLHAARRARHPRVPQRRPDPAGRVYGHGLAVRLGGLRA